MRVQRSWGDGAIGPGSRPHRLLTAASLVQRDLHEDGRPLAPPFPHGGTITDVSVGEPAGRGAQVWLP